MKLLTIVGARPQFVKAAVVSRAIAEHNSKIQDEKSYLKEVLVHTGQHYDANMSEVFFTEMHIPQPDYYLGIGGGSHGEMTGLMLKHIEEVIVKEKPDTVLVYGDTNSTLAGALAAVKLHVPVAHVEAGLRSFNTHMPEEINRILTDRVSHWLFCPTETAVHNLQAEGIPLQHAPKGYTPPKVKNVGDVMCDAALFYKKIAQPSPVISALLREFSQGFYLATVHRAENADDTVKLDNIMKALDEISKTTTVILPLHPRTRKVMERANIDPTKIKFLEPVGYFDMVYLLSECRGVFTDSGGLQKEAFFFAKPCITLREETEWTELVEHGYNTLAGSSYESILAAANEIIKTKQDYSKALYGNGDAGEKIVKLLAEGE